MPKPDRAIQYRVDVKLRTTNPAVSRVCRLCIVQFRLLRLCRMATVSGLAICRSVKRSDESAILDLGFDALTGRKLVRQGKGKRDRLIPIGARALAWIRKYLDEWRPQLKMETMTGRCRGAVNEANRTP